MPSLRLFYFFWPRWPILIIPCKLSIKSQCLKKYIILKVINNLFIITQMFVFMLVSCTRDKCEVVIFHNFIKMKYYNNKCTTYLLPWRMATSLDCPFRWCRFRCRHKRHLEKSEPGEIRDHHIHTHAHTEKCITDYHGYALFHSPPTSHVETKYAKYVEQSSLVFWQFKDLTIDTPDTVWPELLWLMIYEIYPIRFSVTFGNQSESVH